MTRLFTIGCSFTQYYWPTWANILGRQFDFFENWGLLGAGNQYIFNALVECNLKHQLTASDTVIIMWTNVSREDRYVRGEWMGVGNIFTQGEYSKDFVKKYADIRGYYIRDLATVWAVDQLLEKIGCRYIFLSMMDFDQPLQYDFIDSHNLYNDLLKKYQPVLEKIRPSVHRTIFNLDWKSLRPRPITTFLLDQEEQILQRQWRQFYLSVRCADWPEIPLYKDFDTLPVWIQKECVETHGWDAKNILKKYERDKSVRVDRSKDMHPTPVEHLRYLDQAVPEIPVDQDTRLWVDQLEHALANGKAYWDIWPDPHLAVRW